MGEVSWLLSGKQTLTIPNGQLSSDILRFGSTGRIGRWNLTVFAPDVAFTGNIFVYVFFQDSDTVGLALTSGGNDILVPPDRAMVIDPINASGLRFVSSIAEAATRTFNVIGTLARD